MGRENCTSRLAIRRKQGFHRKSTASHLFEMWKNTRGVHLRKGDMDMSAKKNEVATTEAKAMLPANLSALGGVEDNFKGLTSLTLPFIKPEWEAKLFTMPDETPLKTFEGIILRAEPYHVWWSKKISEGGP